MFPKDNIPKNTQNLRNETENKSEHTQGDHKDSESRMADMHSPQNEAENGTADIHSLHGKKKLQYIWDYYKLPLAVICIAIYIIAYAIHGKLTHKDDVLFAALVNVTAGEDLTDALTGQFLESQEINAAKNKVTMYSGLYLTSDENNIYHEYTYASRMKILASINSKEFDVVFMDQEAFDAFAQNGYLCDLDKVLAEADPALHDALEPYFSKNIVILEDNSIDLILDETLTYSATTEEYFMGLDLSASPLIQSAGFEDAVYLGILQNSPRMDMVFTYLRYLYGLE